MVKDMVREKLCDVSHLLLLETMVVQMKKATISFEQISLGLSMNLASPWTY